MNDAPDLVVVDELGSLIDALDHESMMSGTELLDALLNMPKHIRAALAKRLMENV